MKEGTEEVRKVERREADRSRNAIAREGHDGSGGESDVVRRIEREGLNGKVGVTL